MKTWLKTLMETSDSFNRALQEINLKSKKQQKLQRNNEQKLTQQKLSQIDFQAEQTLQYLLSAIPEDAYDQQNFEKTQKLKVRFIPQDRKTKLFSGVLQSQKNRIQEKKKRVQIKSNIVPELFKGKAQFALQKDGKTQRFTFQAQDLDKLRKNIDLNDTIIENYIKIIKMFVIPSSILDRTFIFSSFFTSQLMGDLLIKDEGQHNKQSDKRPYQEIKQKIQQNYQKVKRWTRKIDIFNKDFLVIPVNSNNHWNCFIIINPSSIANPDQNKKCKIIGLDSMSEIKQLFYDGFKIYLQIQMQQRNQKQIQTKNIPGYQIIVPRQTNHHDCGLFVMCYIEIFLSNESKLMSLQDQNKRNYLDLFPRQIVYPMRTQLKNLYYLLMKNNTNEEKIEDIQTFIKERTKVLNSEQSNDYDILDQKYFEKYCRLSPNYAQENEQKLLLRFYLDIDTNYYEQDQINIIE